MIRGSFVGLAPCRASAGWVLTSICSSAVSLLTVLLIPTLRRIMLDPESSSPTLYLTHGPPHGIESLPPLDELVLRSHPVVTPLLLGQWMLWINLAQVQRLVMESTWDFLPQFPSHNQVNELVIYMASNHNSLSWIPTFHISSLVFEVSP
ncbi:hypothetical protein DL96DRAFT_1810986 [Flagelloscypha sp. PMI_526]|nr:hypothetical protein DL96DRAFT_1810986 [Flagelloscypha sp. PMI_526]